MCRCCLSLVNKAAVRVSLNLVRQRLYGLEGPPEMIYALQRFLKLAEVQAGRGKTLIICLLCVCIPQVLCTPDLRTNTLSPFQTLLWKDLTQGSEPGVGVERAQRLQLSGGPHSLLHSPG